MTNQTTEVEELAQVYGDMLKALKAALPHVERLAGFQPTTNANFGKVLQARKDRDRVIAAIARAEAVH